MDAAGLVAELRARRESLGLSQASVGFLTRSSRAHIAKLERGTKQPSREFLLRWIAALDLEINLRPKSNPPKFSTRRE